MQMTTSSEQSESVTPHSLHQENLNEGAREMVDPGPRTELEFWRGRPSHLFVGGL